MRYVAFFGSINVGGNRLLMADLRDALEREEFEAVETVVASGNVLFSHEERPSDGLASKMAWVMRDRFDIDSAVVVMSRDELAAMLAENPFHGQGDDKFVHTHLLMCQPTSEQFRDLIDTQQSRGPERLAAGTRALHVDFVDGVANSRMTGAFMERKLGCRGTARNMRSLKRILAKMDEIS